MATMNVSLPDMMKDWVETQVNGGRYSNVSDYIRDLIRREQERIDKLITLQNLITEGVQSGISQHSMEEVLEIARKKIQNEQQA